MRARFATLLFWIILALGSANTAQSQNLTQFTVNPWTVVGGVASTGTVTLSSNNYADGTIVYLTSSNPSVASVPSQLWLAYHVTSKSFPITTYAVTTSTNVQLSARTTNTLYANLTVTAQLLQDIPLPAWAEDVVPTDSSPAPSGGPSSGTIVDLATGVEENRPDPDLIVRNPNGPTAVFARVYRSARASSGYGSAGLWPGWMHNYDVTVTATTPGSWGSLQLNYPNGAAETWTMGSGTPPSSINAPTGAPYYVTGQASGTTGQWTWLKVTFKDLTSWTFTPSSGNANFYLLTSISNIANHALNIIYDPTTNRLTSVTDDSSPANTLLSFTYSGGYLSTVEDMPGSRTITYASNTVGSATELHTVSQINTTTSYAWQYDYTAVNGWPLLTQAGVQDPTGNSSNITEYPASGYDASGRITTLQDANSNQRLYTYNSGNTQVQVKRSDGTLDLSFTQNFDTSNRNTGFTDANIPTPHTETIGYTDNNNLYQPTSDKNRNGQQASFTYDQFGNISTVAVPCNGSTLTTSYLYDYSISPLGLLKSVQEGSKTPTQYTYYPAGSSPTTNGGFPGQLETLSLPTPGTSGANTWVQENYYYTINGNIDHITSPAPNSASGVVTTQYYYTSDPEYPHVTAAEALGQPLAIHIIDQNGTTVSDIHYRYDPYGNRSAMIDALGNEIDYAHNANQQLTSILYPATGQTGSGRAHTDFTYLHPGGLLQSINYYDESGNQANQETVGLGSEAEAKTQAGMAETVSLGYDSDYRPKTMTDGNNNTEWSVGYDPIGDMNSLAYPNGDSLSWGFDNDGNFDGRTDGLSRNTTYDLATDDSRLNDIKYGDNGTTPEVTFSYDAYDRVSQMTDGSGTTAYSYDDLDNITSVTTTYTGLPARAVQYTYNTDGTRASMTLPSMPGLSGSTYTYQYNALGEISEVFCPWAGGAYQYAYKINHSNNRTNGWIHEVTSQQTNGQEVITYYDQNARGFLVSLLNVWSPDGGTDQYTGSYFYNFKYDALGNGKQVSVNFPQVGFAADLSGVRYDSYDSHNRLTEDKWTLNSTGNNLYDDVFVPDGDDNFTTLFGNTVQYNADDQIKNNANYAYDNDGNATASPIDGAATTYVFDAEDRPTSVGSKLNMAWKGDGQRAWKQGTSGQQKEYFLYDGDTVVAEMDSNGTVIHAYGYGPTGLLQRYYPATQNAFYTTYLFDPLGNLCQRFKSVSSTPSDNALYDGLGYLRYDTDANAGGAYAPVDPIGGRGQSGMYSDEELRYIPTGSSVATTGLAMAASKYYDPNTGRYLERAGDKYFNEYEPQMLPYRVLSGLAKGFANAAVASITDLAQAALTVHTLDGPIELIHIPEDDRHPFQTDGSKLERLSEATGEFTFIGLSTFLSATSAVSDIASAARVEASAVRTIGTANDEDIIRLRHFTSQSSMKKIREEQVIVAYDQNRVFSVRARGKPKSPRDVEEMLGIRTGRGNAYIDFNALRDEAEIRTNPITGATEYVIHGDVDLTERQPTFHQNR